MAATQGKPATETLRKAKATTMVPLTSCGSVRLNWSSVFKL